MGNSHLSGWKTRQVYGLFRDRDFELKCCQEQREEAMRVAQTGKFGVSIFGIRFPFLELTQRIANRPAIGVSDVEQWKQIPSKAESGTHAFL